MQVFKECHMYDDNGNSFELSLITCKCIAAYVKNKKNQNQVLLHFSLFYFFGCTSTILHSQKMQICWIWQKIKSDDDRGFQRFLDNVQYKSSGILRYEHVFGDGFVSTGGISMYKFVS